MVELLASKLEIPRYGGHPALINGADYFEASMCMSEAARIKLQNLVVEVSSYHWHEHKAATRDQMVRKNFLAVPELNGILLLGYKRAFGLSPLSEMLVINDQGLHYYAEKGATFKDRGIFYFQDLSLQSVLNKMTSPGHILGGFPEENFLSLIRSVYKNPLAKAA